MNDQQDSEHLARLEAMGRMTWFASQVSGLVSELRGEPKVKLDSMCELLEQLRSGLLGGMCVAPSWLVEVGRRVVAGEIPPIGQDPLAPPMMMLVQSGSEFKSKCPAYSSDELATIRAFNRLEDRRWIETANALERRCAQLQEALDAHLSAGGGCTKH